MRYEFILASVSDGQMKILQKHPIGWDTLKKSLLRDDDYFGFFKMITVELEFAYDGNDFLRNQFALFGYNANVLLFIRKDKNPFLKAKFNFDDYNIDEEKRTFSVDVIQSDFVQKIHTRDEQRLNILNDRAIDGQFVSPANLIDVILRNQIITYNSKFQLTGDEPEDNTLANLTRTLPLEPTLSDQNPQVNSPFYIAPDPFTNDVPIGFENSLYHNLKTVIQSIKLDISYVAEETAVNFSTPSGQVKGWSTVVIERYNQSDVLQETLLYADYQVTGTYTQSSSYDITFQSGDYLLAYVLNHSFIGGFGLLRFQNIDLKIKEDSEFQNTTCKDVLPHEMFENLVAQMTGKQGRFYSEIFGRTDLGYAEDGEAAYDARSNGKLIRGFELSETELSFNFKERFKNYSKTYCLGMMVKNDVVHIDRLDTLFNKQSVLKLGEVSKLNITPAKDFIHNSVKVGYKDQEFEEVNGVDEFNGTSYYTNDVVPFKSELDLVSTDVASGLAHELARRKQKSLTGTEDTRWDSLIFQTRVTKIGNDYFNERQEKIDYATGILSPTTTMNLYIAPAQNLKRWEKYLGISTYKSSPVYNYQNKDFNSKLAVGAITPDGVVETKESDDLTVVGKYFVPEKSDFDFPLTIDILTEILKDPLQILEFTYRGKVYYHYLYEIDTETNPNKGSWSTLALRSFAQEEAPVNFDLLSIVKWGDGDQDYVKWGDGDEDYVLWQ